MPLFWGDPFGEPNAYTNPIVAPLTFALNAVFAGMPMLER